MYKKFLLSSAAIAIFAGYAAPANALLITLDSFTGDDAQMQVDIQNAATGVTADFGFTALSTFTGDITGVWLGIIDSVFDPSTISLTDITVEGLPATVTYSVVIGSGIEDLGNGVNLTGESGFALLFDFDIGLKQDDSSSNDIISNLFVRIATSGLLESMFDAAGARVQTSDGPEGSSKLAGGSSVVQVSEPSTLGLLGVGLLLAGALGRRGRKARV